MKCVVLPQGPGLLLTALGLALLAGCDSGTAKYTPSSNEARSSLEAALNTWREGKPPSAIDVKPPVHVIDSAWQGGQQIESFAIGDEQDQGDGTKQFPVKLITKPKGSEQEVKFVVHGRDPVYVFREEDYVRTLNMDNNPLSPTPRPGSRPTGRQR
jgi:hypothetical protein